MGGARIHALVRTNPSRGGEHGTAHGDFRHLQKRIEGLEQIFLHTRAEVDQSFAFQSFDPVRYSRSGWPPLHSLVIYALIDRFSDDGYRTLELAKVLPGLEPDDTLRRLGHVDGMRPLKSPRFILSSPQIILLLLVFQFENLEKQAVFCKNCH